MFRMLEIIYVLKDIVVVSALEVTVLRQHFPNKRPTKYLTADKVGS